MRRDTNANANHTSHGSRDSVARRINEAWSMDAGTAAMVRSLTGIDPSTKEGPIGDALVIATGREGDTAWASVVEIISDEEGRFLYGDGFAVRLPVASTRHADRECAVALALLSIPSAPNQGLAAA